VHLRRLGAPVLAAAGAIVTAASLAPAARASRLEMRASARPSHGYAVSVLRNEEVTGGVLLRRVAGHQAISRVLDLEQGGRLTATPSLSRGRARFRYGPRGHVALRFRATGRLRRLGLDSCGVGQLHARRGVFTGVVRVRMGGTLGSLRRTRLHGQLIRDPAPADIFCDEVTSPGTFTRRLSFFDGSPPLDFTAGTLNVQGPLHEGHRWRTDDTIHVTQRGLLAVAPSNRQATATFDGPYATGALTWSTLFPVIPDPRTGEFRVTGTLTGPFTARFDVLGEARLGLTTPADADLVETCEGCG
jgi:hypothetical protein